jgi:hypothetical protein
MKKILIIGAVMTLCLPIVATSKEINLNCKVTRVENSIRDVKIYINTETLRGTAHTVGSSEGVLMSKVIVQADAYVLTELGKEVSKEAVINRQTLSITEQVLIAFPGMKPTLKTFHGSCLPAENKPNKI